LRLGIPPLSVPDPDASGRLPESTHIELCTREVQDLLLLAKE